MRTRSSLAGSIIALAIVAGSVFPVPAQAKVNVVCALPGLAEIARIVGGDRVSVISLARGSQDPHFVDPKPSFMVKLAHADLFCLQGLELEIGWVPPLLVGCGNPNVQQGAKDYCDCSEGIPVLEKPTREVTRAQGDVHPYGNPHYDTDPLNSIIVAGNIVTHLKEKDPSGAATYDANLNAFTQRIYESTFGKDLVDAVGGAKLDRLARDKELDAFLVANPSVKLGGWMATLLPIREHPIIAYHKNLEYFVDRFGIEIAGYMEPKPGLPPSPAHLVDLVALIRARKIKLIVSQPFYNPGPQNLVASKTGAKVVMLPSSVDQVDDINHYFQLIDYMCKTLVEGNK